MGSLGQWISDFVAQFGSFGLALLMFLENVFPPIPSELILPLAGFFVGQGSLGFFGALVGSTAGSLAGALLLYEIGRRGGRPIVQRHGRRLGVTMADVDRADHWFDKYGDWVVLFARMIPIARSIVSLPAGVSEMPVLRFVLLSTVGSALWNALLIGAGYLLGENYQQVADVVGQVSNVVLVLFVAATIAAVVWLWRRSKKKRRPR